jgi:5-carboxymethyl-2-hydroxymuconate isomerase
MPHLTLEYTNNLPEFDVQQILLAINTILIKSGHFEGPDIKSRAVRLDHFMVGNGSVATAFAHVTLRLLHGRSPETKSVLANSLLGAMQSAVQTDRATALQLSVEICDMERTSYAKYAM